MNIWVRIYGSAKGVRRGKPSGSSTGFALITAMALMAFILLLLLTLTSHLRLEISGKQAQQAKLAAHQNAVLGMNIAVGHLQRSLGPDQRVSARADILDSDGSGADIDHPLWTGVWDTSGTIQTWLISGNTGNDPLAWEAADSSLGAGNAIVLFNPDESTEDVAIWVPEVETTDVSGRRTGAYAYWVADEGVKAKMGRVEAIAATTPNAAFSSAQRFGINAVTDLGWYALDSEESSQLMDRETAEVWANAMGASGSIRRHFHDVTPYGYGVYSNTADGGLMRDLTAGMRGTASEFPSGSIFAPRLGPGATLEDPGGPDWSQLRSWILTTVDNGEELPVRQATDEEAGYYPVISSFQIYFYPTYNADQAVDIHMAPAVVLWNPYDRPLEATTYIVRAGRSHGATLNAGHAALTDYFNNWYIRLQDGEDADGIPTFEYLPGQGEAGSFSPTRFEMRFTPEREDLVFHIPNVRLEAGESVVFSPASGHEAYTFGGLSDSNELAPGFRPGWSFYFPTGRTLNLDEDTNEPFLEYLTNVEQTRIQALQLQRQTVGGGGETLMDLLYLSLRYPGAVGPPAAIMNPKPSSAMPMAPSEAIGPRFLRTYVQNDTNRPLLMRPKWLANQNPRAATQGPVPYHYHTFYGSDLTRNPSVITMLEGNADWQTIHADESHRVPVGLSDFGSVNRTVLFETSPGFEGLHSIGQLAHAPLYRWHAPGTTPASEIERLRDRNATTKFDNLVPAYAIGNSLADPRIPLDAVHVDWGEYPPAAAASFVDFQGLHYDYSYLLNESLWDGYFFSTLSENEPSTPSNPRVVLKGTDGGSFQPGYRTSAASLMVDGAFNVNSTSEEAWKALFASFYGQDVELRSGVLDVGEDEMHSPFLRINHPYGSTVDAGGNASSQNAYDGYRRLSDPAIGRLAEMTVAQVRARGPFTRLSDFVNRSLDPDMDAEYRLRGALAAALENSGINTIVQELGMEAEPSGLTGYLEVAEEGWRTENIPGWLSQADLLARLGAVLSVRSDVFLIRVYGESSVTSNDTEAQRAWGELVLQRMPHFVDSSNPPETPFDDVEATSMGLDVMESVNRVFGRSFQVVSFRWLHESQL